MKNKQKNTILFMLYALCIGSIIGLVVWCFLRIVNIATDFIWETMPFIVKIPFYKIIVCTLGGILIGIWRKKAGDYPEDLETVIVKVKRDGRYPYKNIGAISISAMLPLIFGASVGPEAGLTGIIVGLCTWLRDKFNNLFKEMNELAKIGISATLATIFNAPMFGFVEPIESEDGEETLPKTSKVVLYFLAVLGAFGIVILLDYFFQGNFGLADFKGLEVGVSEYLWIVPLSLVGIIAGYLYFIFKKVITKLSQPLKNYTITKCILSGLILGISGTFLPYTMFSGEHEMGDIIDNFQEIGIVMLLLIAIIKLFITNLCIIMGFKGGHFFPCIFCGICIGYAFSLLIGVNSVFCVCVVTTALIAFLIKKPLATVLLLMICFPIAAIPVMLFSAVIGSIMKMPKFLKDKQEV